MNRKSRYIETASMGPSMLDEPVISMREPSSLSSFFFCAFFLLLGGFGAMGCFFTGFDVPVNLLAVLLAQLFCILLCTLRFHLPLKGKWVDLGAWGVWGLLVWSCFGDAAEGFMRLFNLISQTYAERLRTTLPLFEGLKALDAPAEASFITVLAALFQFPLIWLLSLTFIRFKSGVFSFAITGVFLLAPMAFSIVPDSWALTLLTLFWLALLMAVPSMHRQRSLKEENLHRGDTDLARASSLWLIGVLGLYMLLFYLVCPAKTYQRPEIAQRAYSAFADGLNLPLFFQDGNGNRSQRVDLTDLSHRQYNGATILRVKREYIDDPPPESADLLYPQKEYLKSFVGSKYTGSSWEVLDWKAAQRAEKLLAGQRVQTLPSQLSRRMPSIKYGQLSSYALFVENLGAGAGSIFAPYGLSAWEPLPNGVGYLDDGGFRSTRLFGTKSYSFTVDALPGYGRMALSYPERLLAMNTTDGISLMDELLDSPSYQTDPSFGATTSDLWAAPPEIQDLLSTRQLALADALEGYSGFLYADYLTLPQALGDFLTEYLEENGVSLPPSAGIPGETAGRLDYIRAVSELLQKNNRYSLRCPELPRGGDFVEYFLSESRTGYCTHFATAAVALFRLAGIPARYAEGYAVPLTDSWVNVPDYNFHAWPEVWIGGLGWIPVEVTPAGPEAPAAYDNAIAPASDNGPLTDDPDLPVKTHLIQPQDTTQSVTVAPTATPAPPEERTEPSRENRLPGWALFLSFTGALILLAAILALQRLLRLFLRKRRFARKDRSRAALDIYAHIVRLHRQCSKVVIHVSVDPPPEMEEIALKARFSTHDPTEEEISRMRDYCHDVEHKITLHFHPLQAWFCKYILCLF